MDMTDKDIRLLRTMALDKGDLCYAAVCEIALGTITDGPTPEPGTPYADALLAYTPESARQFCQNDWESLQ
jgi:hypothetical protein